jgi:exonuclease SbcC
MGDDTRVRLETVEGNVIERVRTASRNEYIVNGTVLEAFGTDVPEEVEKILRIDQYNIQSQMDMPFLLANSPGEAARLLNQAASIDEIDVALSGLKKAHDQIARTIKYDEEKLQTHQANMGQYENIPKLEKKIEKAERLDADRTNKQAILGILRQRISALTRILVLLDETEQIPQISRKYDVAEGLNINLQQKQESRNRLAKLCSRVKYINEELKTTENIDEAIQLHTDISGLKIKRDRAARDLTSIKSLIAQMSNAELNLVHIDSTIQDAEQEYQELMPDICPLCGSEVELCDKN